MKIVHSPPRNQPIANGGCFLCPPALTRQDLVDVEVIVRNEGHMYICRRHVELMMRAFVTAFKFTSPATAQRLKDDNARLRDENGAMRRRIRELEEALGLVEKARKTAKAS